MSESAGSIGTIQRQLSLLRLLSSRRLGVTADELKSELAVSLKTVRRDLVRLQEVGFPLSVSIEDHNRQRWKLDGDSITGAALAFDEAYALVLLAGSLGSLANTPIGQAAQSAVKKLRSGLSENVIRYCDRYGQMMSLMHPRSVDYSDKSDLIDELIRGHEERKNVFIAYHSRSSTESLTYPISPYAFRRYQNALYVIGYSEQHSEVRLFKLDRISDASISEFPFVMPSHAEIEDHFKDSIGIFGGNPVVVQIRFSPGAARAVQESKWHDSQQLATNADGSVTAMYRIAINPELHGWILSFGADAKVLSPPSLADEIRTQSLQIARQYQAANMEVTDDDGK
ncbi:helix-turn-helix transcriptional regulator [Planctomycetes bacterium K23_9]|uniref:HTH domain protein n=1 Tax=Stieleria marina TaxID=1930275 RepID=A0A517P2K6_9BACT|nr:HTH domain protein [Planctomycetes bacterium K23_9]